MQPDRNLDPRSLLPAFAGTSLAGTNLARMTYTPDYSISEDLCQTQLDQMSGVVLMIKTYRDLIVLQKSTAMFTDFYRVTRDFPQDELF